MKYFKKFIKLKFYIIVLVVLLLCGCKVGHDYKKETVKIPEYYKEAGKEWKPAVPKDEAERGDWWTIFNNVKLNSLEEKLNVDNLNIALAEAQYREARALVEEAKAGYFPTVTGASSRIRQKQPRLNSSPINSTSNTPYTTNSLSLTATWEPDLWGGIRRAVEASTAGAQASAAQLASVRLSMQASLAQYYFQLCILDMDQKILNDTVSAYQKLLQITKNQYAAGTASQLNIIQAQSALQSAQTQAIDNAVNRSLYEHAIAVLIGEPVANFSLPPQTIALTPPYIPVEVPSVLLERRPDIAAAERLMAQANAEIGVATSAYFPIVTLSGTGGFQSNSFRHWFSQPAKFWSLGPQLAATLFDGGLRSAQLKAAKANYDASIATYRQTVLSAFQNVEDNLATLRILKTEADLQNKIVKNAELALKITLNGYQAGTASSLDVTNAQITLYTAKKSATDLTSRRLVAGVGLITALGGGWRPDET